MAAKKQQSTELEQELQTQVEALTEALQRERADSANIRRRHDEQVAELKNVVKAGVVRDLLPVIDNLERALKHAPSARTWQTMIM
jgi:molecular chaperone GrpE